MINKHLPLLKFERHYTSGEFRNPKGFSSEFTLVQRNRQAHGQSVRENFQKAVSDFQTLAQQENTDLFTEDIVYLEFESEPGFFFETDRFDDGHGRYRLSYSRIESRVIEGEEARIQCVGVFINRRGVETFLRKIDQYLTENTPEKNLPKNQKLVDNIASIKAATLECFWNDLENPFPQQNSEVWWEIWLRRDDQSLNTEEDEPVIGLLKRSDATVGKHRLLLPEHIVILAKGTIEQLSNSLLYTNKLAELRKPQETAEFFLHEEIADQHEWIQDLSERIVDLTHESNTLICLLDSGVNRGHDLLAPFLPQQHMYTINQNWGSADSFRRGHGTQSAGNALYGDLAEVLQSRGAVYINHKLESVKLFNPSDQQDPKLYGFLTKQAAYMPVVDRPEARRVYCMTVTSKSYRHMGEPSSWSSAIDYIINGSVDEPNDRSILAISAGNVEIDYEQEYRHKNELTQVHDPGHAFNALTIGAYTAKYQIHPETHPDSRLLATPGTLSPYSSTGINIEQQWANKPDVVFEGGNIGVDQQGIIDPDSLKLLSTGPNPQRQPLSDNFATSAATALASKFVAELYSEYPQYRPETIRGLVVHSAEWNEPMKNELRSNGTQDKRNLLRTYGYGIPDINKAKYCAGDRLTLIAERSIQPYRMPTNEVSTRLTPKINEYHLFKLPWPREVLEGLFDEGLRLNVTLSYFIEPNPGKKVYSKTYSYQSVALRFKMNKANESVDHFRTRINKLARDVNYQSQDQEPWFLGPEVRDRGSIHRDWCYTTGPELATRNLIAVFPITGWWKTRTKIQRYEQSINYSLIITIDAPNVELEVDLYAPVSQQVDIDIDI